MRPPRRIGKSVCEPGPERAKMGALAAPRWLVAAAAAIAAIIIALNLKLLWHQFVG